MAEPGREGIEEISSIAYGFMGSQALFAALELGLFTSLNSGSRDEPELADELGARPEALRTLLTACRALGLLEKDEVPQQRRRPALPGQDVACLHGRLLPPADRSHRLFAGPAGPGRAPRRARNPPALPSPHLRRPRKRPFGSAAGRRRLHGRGLRAVGPVGT